MSESEFSPLSRVKGCADQSVGQTISSYSNVKSLFFPHRRLFVSHDPVSIIASLMGLAPGAVGGEFQDFPYSSSILLSEKRPSFLFTSQ